MRSESTVCCRVYFCFLQAMCVENECVLELHSNPLFTPVPVMNGSVPLKGCVLSVSQFTGAEKKSVESLAQSLGAVYVYISLSSSSFCVNIQKTMYH